MENNIICQNCNNEYDETDRIPMNLPCSHAICNACLSQIKTGEKIRCNTCNRELSYVDTKELMPDQMILSKIHKISSQRDDITEESHDETHQSMSMESSAQDSQYYTQSTNTSESIDYCNKHPNKDIVYFCKTCLTTVCSICIFEVHNGHQLSLLEEMSMIIKNNIKDFQKIINDLEKLNQDNQLTVETKLEEVEKQKEHQLNLVNKSFEEIRKKINLKQEMIIKEFIEKYGHETKRFSKLNSCLLNNQKQIEIMLRIDEQLNQNFANETDAKILNRIDDYTSYLHRSASDIKRYYKTEISVKAELVIDPAMKPIPINITNLLELFDKIDPNVICYPYQDSSRDDTDTTDIKSKRDKKDNDDFPISKLTKKSFDEEIDNYINRIHKYESGKSDTEKYSHTEDNKSRHLNKKQKQHIMKNNSMGRIPNNIYKKNAQRFSLKNYQQDMNEFYQPVMNTEGNYNHSHHYPNSPSNKMYNSKYRIPSAQDNPRKSIHNKFILPIIGNEPQIDSIAVYCFGEASYCLKFNITSLKWEVFKYNQTSMILGSMRYSSICTLPGQKMIMTGGCKTNTNEPCNTVIEINTNNINSIQLLHPMITPRYAHSSIYHRSNIFVIGGFDHKDEVNALMQSTLKACERYDLTTQRWEPIASMNHPRAFFGCGLFMNNIFVFGGMYNNILLSSIECYDPLTNVWITYDIKLPEKLAKIGVLNYQQDTIVLLGGINEEHDPITTVRKLHLGEKRRQWHKSPEMICSREAWQSTFFWQKNIYALGGSIEGVCETYDFSSRKWEMIPSYFAALKIYQTNEVIKNFTCAINFYSIGP